MKIYKYTILLITLLLTMSPTKAVQVGDVDFFRQVGIGIDPTLDNALNLSELLAVNGAISLREVDATPNTDSMYGKIFVSSIDNNLYYKDDVGNLFILNSLSNGGVINNITLDNISILNGGTIQANEFIGGSFNGDGSLLKNVPASAITGLGTMSAQDANAVAITGGSINNIVLTAAQSNGSLLLEEVSAGEVAVPGFGKIYVKTSDSSLYFMDENGNESVLAGSSDLGDANTLGGSGKSEFLLKADNLSGLADQAQARANLGLGSIATQNADSVAITGGSITNIDLIEVEDAGELVALGANNIDPSISLIDKDADTNKGPRVNFIDQDSNGLELGSAVLGYNSSLDRIQVFNGNFSLVTGTYYGDAGGLINLFGPNVVGAVNNALAAVNADNATTANYADLAGSIDGFDSTDFLLVANNLSDLDNASTARSNLGLGNLATQNLEDLGFNGGDLENITLVNVTIDNASILNGGVIKADEFIGGTFNGAFIGDGAQLTNIPNSAVNGLGDLATQDMSDILITESQISGTISGSKISGAVASALTASNADNATTASVANFATTAGDAATLDGLDSTDFLQAANNLADVDNASTARSNLGLGSLATQEPSDISLDGGVIRDVTINGNSFFNGNTVVADSFIGGTFTGDGSGLTGVTATNANFATTAGDAATLDGLDSTDFLQAANNLSDIDNASTARSNLGLGSLATQEPGDINLDGGVIRDVTINGNSFFNGNTVVADSFIGGTFTGDGSGLTGVTATNANFATTAGDAATLDGLDSTDFLQAANNLSDIDNASTARSNLGLGSLATQEPGDINLDGGVIRDVTINGNSFFNGNTVVADNFIGGTFTGDGSGLTGVTADASDITGLGDLATQDMSDILITESQISGTISGSKISGAVALATNANFATTAGDAATLDGLDSTDFLQAANNLSDLNNAATARNNLGLGSIATQNANSVAITGGSLTGSTSINTSGTVNTTAKLSSTNSIQAFKSNEEVLIGNDSNAPAIELRDRDNNTGKPYIDFTNDSTTDFDARFVLEGNDRLDLDGANLNVDGTITASAFSGDGSGLTGVTADASDITGLGDLATQDMSDILITESQISGTISGSKISGAVALATNANNASFATSAGDAETLNGLTASAYAQVANNLSDLSNASAARNNLGLGSIATQNANSVAITGGSLTGSTTINTSGTVNTTAKLSSTNSIQALKSNEEVLIGNDSNAPAIELRDRDNNTGKPYIDFTNDSTTDFDARFVLEGNNRLDLDGANLNVDGTVTASNFIGDGSGLTGVSVDAGDITGTIASATNADTVDNMDASDFVQVANNLSDVNAAAARSNLGLGSIATQNYNNVTITGGTIGGVSSIAVGQASASEALHVAGNVQANAYFYNSDRRLKEEISTLENSLELVKQIRGVSFKWKKSGDKDIGFIAQEVEAVIPDLVKTNNTDGIKAVKYANMVAVLIEAMKEQQATIEEQSKDIEELKVKIEELESNI